MAWIYRGTDVFDRVGAPMLVLFSFTVTFQVTSLTTLRERQSGTLERLLTTPLRRHELIGGHSPAFVLPQLLLCGLLRGRGRTCRPGCRSCRCCCR